MVSVSAGASAFWILSHRPAKDEQTDELLAEDIAFSDKIKKSGF